MLRRPVFALVALVALPLAAAAHPHVTVSVKTVVMTDAAGAITALRHAWTFDDAFSAFSTMGLDKNKDGKLDREELGELAKINVESLSEYGYFSELKTGKDKAAFQEVKDYYLHHDGKSLTLHFTLPVKDKGPDIRATKLEVYDPTYFVAFGFAPQAAVSVEGGPACTATINTPKGEIMSRLSQLSEADFTAGKLGASDWASPVSFSCK
jgi:ABC-type uncharacterized transport system substrate-binding protein